MGCLLVPRRSRRHPPRVACAVSRHGAAASDPTPPKPSSFASEDDTIGDLKKLVAAQTGTRPDKLRIQKWHNVFKVGVGGWGGVGGE